MKCVACGFDLPEGATFCINCGAKQPEPAATGPIPAAAPEPTATGPMPAAVPTPVPSPEPYPAYDPAPKPKRAVPKALIIGAIVLAVLAAIGIPLAISQRNAQAYEQAMSLFDSEQYRDAADAFEALGDYEDSHAMMQQALLGASAQSQQARAGEDPAAWEATAQVYERLGTDNGRRHAQECRDTATYYTGVQLMQQGSWAEAIETLSGLEAAGFKDVFELVTECNAHIDYDAAVALMDAGSWSEARDALAALADLSYFDDVTYRIGECDAHIDYDAAEALLAEGRYYDAYVAFMDLVASPYGSLPDCAERAQACIQSFPGDGAVYSSPDYPSTAVPLTITNSGTYALFKFYIGDDLVRTVFIYPNSTATVYLPSGTYRMNEAHGDLWFGDSDMFGDEGSYYQCSVGGNDTFELQYGYMYEISADVEGEGISNESVDRGSF